MRPRPHAVELEIVGVGHRLARRLLGLLHAEREAGARRIGDRLLLAVEPQPDLLSGVAGAGPAHQRLDLARTILLELQQPQLAARGARLHRALGLLVDACARHRGSPRFAGRRMVGAAGFEPATLCSQSRRPTRRRTAPRPPCQGFMPAPPYRSNLGIENNAATSGSFRTFCPGIVPNLRPIAFASRSEKG